MSSCLEFNRLLVFQICWDLDYFFSGLRKHILVGFSAMFCALRLSRNDVVFKRIRTTSISADHMISRGRQSQQKATMKSALNIAKNTFQSCKVRFPWIMHVQAYLLNSIRNVWLCEGQVLQGSSKGCENLMHQTRVHHWPQQLWGWCQSE